MKGAQEKEGMPIETIIFEWKQRTVNYIALAHFNVYARISHPFVNHSFSLYVTLNVYARRVHI